MGGFNECIKCGKQSNDVVYRYDTGLEVNFKSNGRTVGEFQCVEKGYMCDICYKKARFNYKTTAIRALAAENNLRIAD